MLITSQAPPRQYFKTKTYPGQRRFLDRYIYTIVAELILVALTYNDLQHIAERLKRPQQRSIHQLAGGGGVSYFWTYARCAMQGLCMARLDRCFR